MADRKELKFVDDLLAASLRRYAPPEPPEAFARRILAGMRTKEHRRAYRTRVWVLSAVAVGLLIVLGAVTILRRVTTRVASPARPATAGAQPASAPPATLAKAPKPPARAAKRLAVAQLRPAQFPTPEPLSRQEKLLLAYVRNAPRLPEGKANQQPDAELQILPLTIAPLKIKSLPVTGD